MPQDGGENGNGNVTYYYVAQSGQRGGEEQRHGGYGTTGESMRVGGRGERSAQAGGSKHAGAVPPSYEQAVGADNKVQT